jgi:hypothetical protein
LTVGALFGTENGGGPPSDRSNSAFEICKEFVKDRLKSPSSAVFRNFYQDDGEVVVRGAGNGPYTVRSTVNSENSLGAMLRSSFICEDRLTRDTWHLEDLSIQ